MTHTTQNVIQQTKRWIQSVVIDLNLCPFAAQVFIQETIEYIVIEHDNTEHALHQLADSFARLDDNKEIETTLLIFPQAYTDFDSYLELVDLGNRLLDDLNYTGVYQLASFHPQYCFDGCEENDAGNFSNRSPYPMLHILREDSIQKAVDGYENIEDIPQNNINKLHQIGFEKMQQTLQSILDVKQPVLENTD